MQDGIMNIEYGGEITIVSRWIDMTADSLRRRLRQPSSASIANPVEGLYTYTNSCRCLYAVDAALWGPGLQGTIGIAGVRCQELQDHASYY